MILHLSHALAKRLRCDLSLKNGKVAQPGHKDSWSADIFRIRGLGSHALIMHDASLWPIILDLKECTTYEIFLKALLVNIEMSYVLVGGDFDSANISVVATKRSNRSIIGSMNNAIYLIESHVHHSREQGIPVDWADVQNNIARTPFMSLQGHFPYQAFQRIAGNSV